MKTGNVIKGSVKIPKPAYIGVESTARMFFKEYSVELEMLDLTDSHFENLFTIRYSECSDTAFDSFKAFKDYFEEAGAEYSELEYKTTWY